MQNLIFFFINELEFLSFVNFLWSPHPTQNLEFMKFEPFLFHVKCMKKNSSNKNTLMVNYWLKEKKEKRKEENKMWTYKNKVTFLRSHSWHLSISQGWVSILVLHSYECFENIFLLHYAIFFCEREYSGVNHLSTCKIHQLKK